MRIHSFIINDIHLFQEDQEDDFDYDDDDFSDEGPFTDPFEDIQAEEPTEIPVTKKNYVFRPMSTFSEQKWQQFGTMEKVEQSRNQQLNLRVSKERKFTYISFDSVPIFNL